MNSIDSKIPRRTECGDHIHDCPQLAEMLDDLREENARLTKRVEELERQEGRLIYCGECGQPGECACLGNWRERAEAAENKLADEKESRGWLEAQLRASDAKLARCVEALEQILDRAERPAVLLLHDEELDLKHTYTTCDFGDSTNADRGCLWCVARAALDAAKGGE